MPSLCLSWSSTVRRLAQCSLSEHHTLPSHSLPPQVGTDPNLQTPKNRTTPSLPRNKKQIKVQKKQPTVIQLERAIGAGVFREINPEEKDPRMSVLDGIPPILPGKFESPVEKKLREMGEWIISRIETGSPSAGKNILLGMFQWLLPTWVLLLLIASGIIKLPFSTPFIDDLLM